MSQDRYSLIHNISSEGTLDTGYGSGVSIINFCKQSNYKEGCPMFTSIY